MFCRNMISRISNPILFKNSKTFHNSSIVSLAKKGSKNKESNDDDAGVTLPDVKTYDALMVKRITALKDEFLQIRGGSASKDMLNSINVSAYGTKIPLTEAGQINLKTPNTLSITMFDSALTQFVVTALKDAGMNLNPIVEGSNVVVNVPKPSKEQREMQVKLIGKIAEKTKQDIRQVRKEALDSLKKLKGKVSEDDIRRITKSIDTVAEQNVDKTSKVQKEKEKEILSM